MWEIETQIKRRQIGRYRQISIETKRQGERKTKRKRRGRETQTDGGTDIRETEKREAETDRSRQRILD